MTRILKGGIREVQTKLARRVSLLALSFPALNLLALSLLPLAGCGDTKPSVPGDRAPTACFTIQVEPPERYCPQLIILALDPSCSSDDRTPTESLQVRWDFEGDGVWDTPYFPNLRAITRRLPLFGPVLLTVRCEVRDKTGQLARVAVSKHLGERPQGPELIVNGVWFTTDDIDTDVDTVLVGQEFCLSAGLLRCGDTGDPSITIRYERDGVTIDIQHEMFDGPYECEGWWQCHKTFDVPGRYAVTVILDADNTVAETNERNNAATAVLQVMSR
jgi:hypothetical protein